MPFSLMMQGMMQALIMFAVLMGALAILGMIAIKMKARGKWYIEFNNNGTLSFELVEPGADGVVHATHGDYYVPHTARMKIGYPPGVPAIIQENVWTEKFVMGNPEPIEYDIEDSTNLTMFIQQTREAETRAITQIQEGLASFAGLRNPIMLLIGFGVLLAIAAAGVAAYFGYTTSGELQIMAEKLGNL